MSLYGDVKELLDPIDLTLDMMKKFIQPIIYSGLKSNIEAIYFKTKQQEKKDKRAKKVEELLELYRKAHLDVLNGELAEQIKAPEEEMK